jgi:hypothetical protein
MTTFPLENKDKDFIKKKNFDFTLINLQVSFDFLLQLQLMIAKYLWSPE